MKPMSTASQRSVLVFQLHKATKALQTQGVKQFPWDTPHSVVLPLAELKSRLSWALNTLVNMS